MTGRGGQPAHAPEPNGVPFASVVVRIVGFGLAMGYLEAAVVVYLRAALAIDSATIFPLRDASAVGSYGAIELGREAATLLMLGALGWLAGATNLERLAWTAVAFGIWDVAYYGWLWGFTGWPPSLATWDILFLIPVPWVGPVWAPMAVSATLIGFGLAAARRRRRGVIIPIARRQAAGAGRRWRARHHELHGRCRQDRGGRGPRVLRLADLRRRNGRGDDGDEFRASGTGTVGT